VWEGKGVLTLPMTNISLQGHMAAYSRDRALVLRCKPSKDLKEVSKGYVLRKEGGLTSLAT